MPLTTQNNANPVKVLLIGLDGASFNYIKPWVKDSSLPNLAKIIKEGVSGPLISTIPSVTPPAWTSMLTGTNPGKHGIFHFHDLYARPQKSIVINATHQRDLTLWDILTEVGLPSIFLNVPMTYPPDPINGIMVTGFLTPPTSEDYIHPQSLRDQIDAMGYQIGQMFGARSHLTYEQIGRHIQARTKTAKWLMKNHEWALFMVVYMASDGVVHRYPENPAIIKHVYKLLDTAIGELIDAAPPNTVVLVTSDHGIGLLDKQFMINTWLRNHSFLQFRAKPRTVSNKTTKNLLGRIGGIKPVNRLLHILPFQLRRKIFRQVVPKYSDIDVTKSLAWGVASTRNFAFMGINPSPDKKELVENLYNKLSQITDPRTGQRIVKAVHPSNALLWGPALEGAPQIIIETQEDYGIKCGFTHDRNEIRHYTKPLAAHTREGIFLACGPGIKTQNPEQFSPLIWDVMPTILQILNVAPPHNLDGRILHEIFEPDSPFSQEKLQPATYRKRQRSRKDLTAEEQKRITDRLEQLGYM
ncbi:MAG: alkaline phosphatase family protein [Candidatus Hodarchaeota archaeon]